MFMEKAVEVKSKDELATMRQAGAVVADILVLLSGLKQQGIAVIMIEHIMRAVMSFSQRLVVLVAGRKLADGPPQDVMHNSEVVRAYLGE